jgi:hypothetical protein
MLPSTVTVTKDWPAHTLAKAWISTACPEPTGIKLLGGLGEYSREIGSIVEVAGIKGALGNRDEFYESLDFGSVIFDALKPGNLSSKILWTRNRQALMVRK